MKLGRNRHCVSGMGCGHCCKGQGQGQGHEQTECYNAGVMHCGVDAHLFLNAWCSLPLFLPKVVIASIAYRRQDDYLPTFDSSRSSTVL